MFALNKKAPSQELHHPLIHCHIFMIFFALEMAEAYYYGCLVSCVFLLIAQFEAAVPLLGGKKLIIGIPKNYGFNQFVNVKLNSSTNQVVQVTGYSIEVFNAAANHLLQSGLNVSYEFQAFVDKAGRRAGSYDQLLQQIPDQKCDAVVGDITIVANRSKYVDFTLPYAESGVRMLVRVHHNQSLKMWAFLRPFSWDLWLTITIICICTGAALRFMERSVNRETQLEGTYRHEKFTWTSILWVPLVQIVFPERKSVGKNCSKFVLTVWLILAFVLLQSYTASLSSILTLDQLQPSHPSVNDLQRKGENVGYPTASFVLDLLVDNLKFDKSKLRECINIEDYRDALDKGTDNGGVAAIFDESPYIKVFLKEYGTKYYRIVGPHYRTAGFGFAFPRNSNLTSYCSRGILNVTQGEEMDRIEQKYFGGISDDEYQDQSNTSSDTPSLTTHSFAGLFMITGFLILLALLASERHNWKKPVMLAKTYLFSPCSKKSDQTWSDSIPSGDVGSADEANNYHPRSSSTASSCPVDQTLPV